MLKRMPPWVLTQHAHSTSPARTPHGPTHCSVRLERIAAGQASVEFAGHSLRTHKQLRS